MKGLLFTNYCPRERSLEPRHQCSPSTREWWADHHKGRRIILQIFALLKPTFNCFKCLITLIKVDYLVATEREAIAAEAEKYKASLLSPDPGCQYDQVESWLDSCFNLQIASSIVSAIWLLKFLSGDRDWLEHTWAPRERPLHPRPGDPHQGSRWCC